MCCSLPSILILLLIGTIVLGDEALDGQIPQETALDRQLAQESEDNNKKFYVHSITLRSNSQSEKLRKCHELHNIKIRPTDLTEDQLCEHIIQFNDWMSEQMMGASEKVRDIYEKTLQDETGIWELVKEKRDKLLSTVSDAEKKEFTELMERFTKKAEEDTVLHAHRYVNKMFSFTFGEVMPHYTLSEIPPP